MEERFEPGKHGQVGAQACAAVCCDLAARNLGRGRSDLLYELRETRQCKRPLLPYLWYPIEKLAQPVSQRQSNKAKLAGMFRPPVL